MWGDDKETQERAVKKSGQSTRAKREQSESKDVKHESGGVTRVPCWCETHTFIYLLRWAVDCCAAAVGESS